MKKHMKFVVCSQRKILKSTSFKALNTKNNTINGEKKIAKDEQEKEAVTYIGKHHHRGLRRRGQKPLPLERTCCLRAFLCTGRRGGCANPQEETQLC